MPIPVMTPVHRRRLHALDAALDALGYTGSRQFVWPVGNGSPTLSISPPDVAAQAVIDGWDWTGQPPPALEALISAVSQVQQSLATKQPEIVPFHVGSAMPSVLPANLTESAAASNLPQLLALVDATNARVNLVAGEVNKLRAVVAELIAKSIAQGVQT